MKIYYVHVTREDGAWLADVPEVPGAHTQAANLRTLKRYVREVITLMADYPDEAVYDDEAFDVRLAVEFDDRATAELVEEIRALRERADEIHAQLTELTPDALHRLDEAGLSVRDEAEVLGVSHQRVHQLRRVLQDA